MNEKDLETLELLELVAECRARGSVDEALAVLRQKRFEGVGRNQPCPCGSGRKLKRCCLRKVRQDGKLSRRRAQS